MKKLFLFITLIPLVLSCNESQEEMSIQSPCQRVKVVYVKDGKIVNSSSRGLVEGVPTLSFVDQQAFEDFKDFLSGNDDVVNDSLIGVIGVTPYFRHRTDYENKIDSIAFICSSENEFRLKVNNLMAEYSNKLIKDDIWANDLQMYLPEDGGVINFVANTEGQYIIADEIQDLPVSSSYVSLREIMRWEMFNEMDNELPTNDDEDWIPDFTTVSTEPGPNVFRDLNGFYSYFPVRHKWVTFDAFPDDRKFVTINFTVRRKMWYGWVNDPHRQYALLPNMSESSFYYYSTLPIGRLFSRDRIDKVNLGYHKLTSPLIGSIAFVTDLTVDMDAYNNAPDDGKISVLFNHMYSNYRTVYIRKLYN